MLFFLFRSHCVLSNTFPNFHNGCHIKLISYAHTICIYEYIHLVISFTKLYIAIQSLRQYCKFTFSCIIGVKETCHYCDVIIGAMASQITSLTIVYSTVFFRRRSKKTSKLRVTGLCAGNSPVIDEFFAQKVSNAGNVSIWWRRNANSRLIGPWEILRLFQKYIFQTHYKE